MTPRNLSASSIAGTEVRNSAEEKVGTITDLMINTKDGSIQYAVLSVGGFLGIGDKLFAVPLEAFTFTEQNGEHAHLDVDKERLENAPGFDKDKWPTTATDEYLTKVYTHYGLSYSPRYSHATIH